MHDRDATRPRLAIDTAAQQQFLSRRFGDFEELSATVASWDFDFLQLDAGLAPAALTQLSVPGLLIQRFRFGRTYLQRGSSPRNMRTVGLREPDAQSVRMFGADLMESDLACFQAGGEFESVSRPGFGCLAISIDEAQLDAAFEAADLPPRGDRSPAGSGLLRADPTKLMRLRHRAKLLLDAFEANPGALGDAELLEELAFQLSIDLALAIQSADDAPRRAASRVRDLALRHAVSYIDNQLDEPITIRGVCEEVGVGWTTLVSAFSEHFGVTPKAYLRAVRLNRARRDLLGAAPEALIADAANRQGFWHMGQFAADYKRLFGELPSATRSRIVAPRPGN